MHHIYIVTLIIKLNYKYPWVIFSSLYHSTQVHVIFGVTYARVKTQIYLVTVDGEWVWLSSRHLDIYVYVFSIFCRCRRHSWLNLNWWDTRAQMRHVTQIIRDTTRRRRRSSSRMNVWHDWDYHRYTRVCIVVHVYACVFVCTRTRTYTVIHPWIRFIS